MQVSLNHSPLVATPSARRAERSLAAFSITEVLIGMAIVGFTFVALYGAFSLGFGMIQLSRENLRATQVLMEKMETIRVYNWTQVNTPNFVPTAFTNYYYPPATNLSDKGVAYIGKVSLTPAPVSGAYTNDMRQLTVEITWTSRGQPRTRSMSTFVSQYGIQNYNFL